MKIKIRDIPPGGRDLGFDLDPAWMAAALGGTEADPAASHGRVELFVSLAMETVVVRAQLAGALVVPCGRCLEPARIVLDSPFHVTFAPQPDPRDQPEEQELAEEELDYAYYKGDEIDLGETIREHLLLAIPMAPRCREECAGLCPRCGQDLNEARCACAETGVDPRWSALKDLKDLKSS